MTHPTVRRSTDTWVIVVGIQGLIITRNGLHASMADALIRIMAPNRLVLCIGRQLVGAFLQGLAGYPTRGESSVPSAPD